MYSIFSLTRLFLLSSFFVGVSLSAWAQSSEYGLLLIECTNPKGEVLKLAVDVSEPTADIFGGVVTVSEKNGVIKLNEADGKRRNVVTLIPSIGQLLHNGQSADCIFRDAQGATASITGPFVGRRGEAAEQQHWLPARTDRPGAGHRCPHG